MSRKPIPDDEESVKIELWTSGTYSKGLTIRIVDGSFDNLVDHLTKLLISRSPTKIKLKAMKSNSTKSLTVPYSPEHVKRVLKEFSKD